MNTYMANPKLESDGWHDVNWIWKRCQASGWTKRIEFNGGLLGARVNGGIGAMRGNFRLLFRLAVFAFAAPHLSTGVAFAAEQKPPAVLELTASATNASPDFRKFLYTFPLHVPALLSGLSGSVSIESHGQNFAEALISVAEIPPGQPCPRDGEVYDTYEQIGARYPSGRRLAQFIVKMPGGVARSAVPVQLTFPAGIPVGGALVVCLDGSVCISGGAFVMTSLLTAHLAPVSPGTASAKPVGLDDEFCFGLSEGGELATMQTSPQAAFINVVPIHKPGTLLALYGDVSDSSFGPGGMSPSPAGAGPWAIANDYYLYRSCTLRPGLHGPSDFYAAIPPGAVKLYSLAQHADGQAALQQPVFQALAGIKVQPGDCLVHLIHVTSASNQGGIDAESQVFALEQPTQEKDK